MVNFVFEDLSTNRNFISCKDINLSGIPRFGFSPLVSASNMYFVSTRNKSGIKFISHTENVQNYIIASSVNHSPEDWTGYDPKVKSLFCFLNEKYLTDLRNRKALLLLDSSFEGYQTSWLWDWFHKECALYGISPECIVYVTGNMIVEDVYEKWCDSNNIQERMLTIGYPHFELDIAMSAYNKKVRSNSEDQLPSFTQHIVHKTTNTIKTFSCLNKRIRPHRVWFYRHLYFSGLLDSGLVSMNTFDKHGYFWEEKYIPQEEIEEIHTILPLQVYGKPNNELDDSYYINRFNPEICLDTYVSVVSEAHCGDSDETLFLSEKIYKPIASRHPFLVLGNKDSLKKMRELGYRTFEKFIDQDYDSLPTHERLENLLQSIQKINNIEDKLSWFKLLEEDIEFNYNHLLSKLNTPPQAFIKLQTYYSKFFNK